MYVYCVESFAHIECYSERRVMGMYAVPLSMFGFGMGTVLPNFHMCGIMLVLRAISTCS